MTIRARMVLSVTLVLTMSVAGPAGASEEVAATEELECGVCHDESDLTRLTDQGQYYEYMRTLDGYDRVVARFGGCAYCHVPDVGSSNLTREGYRFRWMMEDMQGLRAWLEENHPSPDDSDESPDDTTRDDGD